MLWLTELNIPVMATYLQIGHVLAAFTCLGRETAFTCTLQV